MEKCWKCDKEHTPRNPCYAQKFSADKGQAICICTDCAINHKKDTSKPKD